VRSDIGPLRFGMGVTRIDFHIFNTHVSYFDPPRFDKSKSVVGLLSICFGNSDDYIVNRG